MSSEEGNTEISLPVDENTREADADAGPENLRAASDASAEIETEIVGEPELPFLPTPPIKPAAQMEFRSNVAVKPPAEPNPATMSVRFRRADLSRFKADPETFYDFGYRATLDAMVAAVVEAESPVRDDVLAQRIARAHGWSRTGGRIRERIDLHLKRYESTADSAGRFIWTTGSIRPVVSFRDHLTEDDRRQVSDIAIAELAGFVREHIAVFDEPDPALVIARMIGLERLAASSRARIEEAIELAKSIAPER